MKAMLPNYTTILQSRTILLTTTSTQVIKRTMMSGLVNIAKKSRTITIPKQSMSYYRIHKTNPTTTSHEQAQTNPLLTNKKTKQTFQHPGLIEDQCDQKDCETKDCSTACGPAKQSAHIGHATHSPTYSVYGVYGSPTDLDNANKPQHIKMYPKPLENTSTDNDTDTQKTSNLQANAQLKKAIHTNKSTNPMEKANTGSDNFDENIN